MTHTYDWLVIGGGLTGAALGYELQKAGLSVAIVEPQPLLKPLSQPLLGADLTTATPGQPSAKIRPSATRASYGGIPYWAASDRMIAEIFGHSWQRYGELATELTRPQLNDLELRTLDLLLTVGEGEAVPDVFSYDIDDGAKTKLPWLSRAEVIDFEPALAQASPAVLRGALHAKHGHINPIKLVQGYLQGLQRLGGTIIPATVTALKRDGCRVVGVETDQGNFYGMDLAVCSGGWSRRLLQESRLPSLADCIYFTHAEVLELWPLPSVIQPQAMIMPAITNRFAIETTASTSSQDVHWQAANHEFLPPSIDIGAIPFQDGKLRIGQVSRVHSNSDLVIDQSQSEGMIRQGMMALLPQLSELHGNWYHTLVSFSRDSLPLVGALPEPQNVHLFTGFTTPFAYVPALAVNFANYVVNDAPSAPIQAMMQAFSPHRFIA
ncbi:MAG: FAD-dependent oxidoreductase [Pseudanabaena sp. ELA607]